MNGPDPARLVSVLNARPHDDIPKVGRYIPFVGRDVSQPSLAGALLTPAQMRVLGRVSGQPDRRFPSGELIRLAKSGTGAVHRQLGGLAAAGLVTVTAVGNQKFYQANAVSPVFAKLRGFIAKTVGLVEPLRRALAPLASGILVAFAYGSFAKGADRADSAVDLMVISDSLHHEELYAALENVERVIGRPVNPTILTRRAWRSKRGVANSLVSRVMAQPRIMVLGSEDDLS